LHQPARPFQKESEAMRAVVVFAIVLLGATSAVARDGTTPAFDDYRALVGRCLDREDGAVEELAAWPADHLKAIERQLPRPDCPDDCLRGAALAHTEAAFVSLPRRVRVQASSPLPVHHHLLMAEALLNCVASGVRDDFRREWSLAVGYRYAEATHYRIAHDNFRWILATWNDDVTALVALGSLYEVLEALPPRLAPLEPVTTFLEQAEYCYRRALSRDPSHIEARLRLGRVLVARAQTRSGVAELRAVLAAEPHGERAAFAHLVLGEVAHAAGRDDLAAEAYRAALAEDPDLQPAQLSLARTLLHASQAAEATEILQKGLGAPPERMHTWFGYHVTLFHGYRQTLGRLRAQVSR
jgi:tetratricopeptide (TPR) repeat protein